MIILFIVHFPFTTDSQVAISTIKLTDRRPDDDVMKSTGVKQPAAQVEVESVAAVWSVLLDRPIFLQFLQFLRQRLL
jgi:hypothetical protein